MSSKTPYETECRIRRHDGAYQLFKVRGVPIFDDGGSVREWVGTCTDITEQTQAKLALHESEERLRRYFNLGLVGMAIAAPDKGYLDANDELCRITGYSREELFKTNWLQLTHPEDRASSLDTHRRIMAGELDGYTMEKRYLRKDGATIHVTVAVKCARGADGSVQYFVALVQDITERKLAEAELQCTQKELVEASRLAGMADVATGVLHNVGNVLNSINIASTCLAEGLKRSKAANLPKLVAILQQHQGDLPGFFANDPCAVHIPSYLKKLSEHLNSEHTDALNELARLQKSVEHIRDIVTIQQNYARNPEMILDVSVPELIEDALSMNLSGLAHNSIEIVRDIRPMPPVPLQKHKLLQILVNLIRNAKDACGASDSSNKKLLISASSSESILRISVTDNGIGIAPENLPRLFTHGFTTKKNGHGFGLNSSALAAREMGGNLTAESPGPGRGATFTVTLPVKA